MFNEKLPQPILLKEAFNEAVKVKRALDYAVDQHFEDAGRYKATNLFDLSMGEYMGVGFMTLMTLGAFIPFYEALTIAENAAADDYRKQPVKHFAVHAKQLDKIIGRLEEGAQKTAFEDFRDAARIAFAAEFAAVSAARAADYKAGLQALKDVRKYDGAKAADLIGHYTEGTFGAPRSFTKNLRVPGTPEKPPAEASRSYGRVRQW